MADLSKFKSNLITNASEETLKFFGCFSGAITLTLSDPFVSYYKPTTEEFSYINQANKAGRAIYFTVNETTAEGRKAENIKNIRAIFCDDDNSAQIKNYPPKTDWPIPPSIVINTSSVEGIFKYHYYWLTQTQNKEEWARVQTGLVEFYGMDINVKDIARILRVPGYGNTKNSTTTPCRIVKCPGNTYTWSDIIKAFPPVSMSKVNEVKGNDPDGEFNEHVMCDRFRNPSEGGYISNSLNSIIMHLANDGRSIHRIKRYIEQLYETVSDEHLTLYKKRYYGARVQVDKWIKTARINVLERRAATAPTTILQLQPEIPEALLWDWSVLQSNPLPEEALPETLLQAAKEIGDWTAVGQDPAILSAVFITSALLSKNVLIHEIGDDLMTHCQSGICIVMDTGARKSAIYNQMNKPFFEFEERLRKEWEETRFITASQANAIDSEIKSLDRRYAKQRDPSEGERETYAISRGLKLLDKSKLQLKQPWLRSADVTEEKLVRKLDENQGCIAIISDDARQVINNITGKYGNASDTGESVYINALTGSSILYERVGSEQEIAIEHPVLNALLFVQPDAALKLRNSEMFVPSGMAARLPMYFYPVSGADIVANTSRRKIDLNKMEPYYTVLRNICVQRIKNPLHIRLDDAGMQACARMDKKFAESLKGKWLGHYDKSNKLITLAIMYATCFAALEDTKFVVSFQNTKGENNSYVLSAKHLNMGFMFADALFGQSITSHQVIAYEALPRKAESFLATLQKWYAEGKVTEGFVLCGALNNHVSPKLRDFLPEITDMLLKRKWLFITKMAEDKRKLNGGFPDKYVDTGDLIYHLNIEGIKKRAAMSLDKLETGLTQQ